MIPDVLMQDRFDAELRRQLASEIRITKPRSWWPSSLGGPCDRQLVWRWTRANEAVPHDPVMQAIFDEGNLHQPAVYDRLEKMGFAITREHHVALEYRVGGSVISGRPDLWLLGFKGERFDEPIPADVKTVQPNAFHRYQTIEDIKNAKQFWVRGYWVQVNLYAFLDNKKHAALILKDKGTGMLRVIAFDLDLDAAEEALKRVEQLQPMVEQQVDPAPISYDKQVCGRCMFSARCYPPATFGKGALIILDSDLEEQLERRAELDSARREYDALDKAIKERLKREAAEQAICGDFIVQTEKVSVKAFSVAARVDTRFKIARISAHTKKIETGSGSSPSIEAKKAEPVIEQSSDAARQHDAPDQKRRGGHANPTSRPVPVAALSEAGEQAADPLESAGERFTGAGAGPAVAQTITGNPFA